MKNNAGILVDVVYNIILVTTYVETTFNGLLAICCSNSLVEYNNILYSNNINDCCNCTLKYIILFNVRRKN